LAPLLAELVQAASPVPFWPFDGWEIPKGESVVAEVSTQVWTRYCYQSRYGVSDRTICSSESPVSLLMFSRFSL
jgi:hypothetical protein